MSGILPPRQHEAHAIASLVELTLMDPDPRTHDFNESVLAAARVVLPWIRRAGLDGWERADGPKVKVASRRRRKPDPPELVAGKAAVADRSGGYCEVQVPGICEQQQTQTHHRAGRKGQGCHDPAVLVAVCGLGSVSGCHGAIHQHPDWARFHGLLYAPLDGSVPAYLGCSLSCEVDHRPIAGGAS